MIEYRLSSLPTKLAELFDELEICVIVEDFSGKTTFLVYSDDDIADILKKFSVDFEFKDIEETGWQEKWKEYIKEDWLTGDIYFIFEPKNFDDGRRTIYINPSLAFGTGAHPTTQIAARLLEKVVKGKSVLDVGTGSGILAVLAEKCGAKHVDAFDIDPSTLPNCLENIKNNDCGKITAKSGKIAEYEGKVFDVIVANIISGVLKEIIEDITPIGRDYIVFSGILEKEYDEVVGFLTPNGAVVEDKIIIGDWAGMIINLKGKNNARG